MTTQPSVYLAYLHYAHVKGVPKHVLIEWCWSHGAHHRRNHQGLAWKLFFWSFLTKTKQDQVPQVMSMVRFSPTALNFDYDFVLLVHFSDTL